MTFKQLYRQVLEIVGDESKMVLAKNLINEVYDEVITETKGYYNQGGLSPDIATTVAKKYQYDITSSLYDKINFPVILIPTIGDTTFTGTGLEDLTAGGTFTGYNDADVKVEIDYAAKVNVNGTAYYATDDTYIYYRNASDGSKLYRMDIDGANSTKLTDNVVQNIISTDGTYVFYGNATDSNKLYRIDIDGSNETKLSNNAIGRHCIDATYVYYSNVTDSNKIYRIEHDGTNEAKISDDTTSFLISDGTYVYYSKLNDSSKLYRMDSDGANDTKLSDKSMHFYFSTDGVYVVFASTGDNKPYRVEIDGTNETKLSDNLTDRVYTDGTYAYYPNNTTDTIYRIDIGGTNDAELVGNKGNDEYFVSGGYLYYSNADDSNTMYKIDVAGTKLTDTFTWSRYGGEEETTGVAITGSSQTLVNGITITFGATTGHILGDVFEYTISVEAYYPELITSTQWNDLVRGGDTYSDIPQYWYMDNQSLKIWPAPATSGNPISLDVMLARADLTADTSEPTIKPGYHQLLVYKPASLILMMKGNINLANSYMALYEKMLKRYKEEVLFATTDVLIPRKRRRFIDPNNYPTVT